MRSVIVRSLILAVASYVTLGASALSFVETTDFANGGSQFAFSVGTLDLGTNTISGSLSGACSDEGPGSGGCNGVFGFDNQDSVNFSIGSGMQIQSITFEYSNFTGPSGVRASVSGTDYQGSPFLSFFNQQQYEPESGFLEVFSGGGREEGLYAMNAFGQDSFEAGEYYFDYTFTINVTEVPLPGALLLFVSAMLFGVRLKKTP